MAKTQIAKLVAQTTEVVPVPVAQEPENPVSPAVTPPESNPETEVEDLFTEGTAFIEFDVKAMQEEADKAEDEYFMRTTSALILHGIVNRASALPSPDGGADQAIKYAEALAKKLALRRV